MNEKILSRENGNICFAYQLEQMDRWVLPNELSPGYTQNSDDTTRLTLNHSSKAARGYNSFRVGDLGQIP